MDKYFIYQIPGTQTKLISSSIDKMNSSIDYYRDRGQPAKHPSPSELIELVEEEIPCARQGYDRKSWIEVEVRESIIFMINSNALDIAYNNSHQIQERGELCKFVTGSQRQFGLYFLDREILEELKQYNWSQHQSELDLLIAHNNLDGGQTMTHMPSLTSKNVIGLKDPLK